MAERSDFDSVRNDIGDRQLDGIFQNPMNNGTEMGNIFNESGRESFSDEQANYGDNSGGIVDGIGQTRRDQNYRRDRIAEDVRVGSQVDNRCLNDGNRNKIQNENRTQNESSGKKRINPYNYESQDSLTKFLIAEILEEKKQRERTTFLHFNPLGSNIQLKPSPFFKPLENQDKAKKVKRKRLNKKESIEMNPFLKKYGSRLQELKKKEKKVEKLEKKSLKIRKSIHANKRRTLQKQVGEYIPGYEPDLKDVENIPPRNTATANYDTFKRDTEGREPVDRYDQGRRIRHDKSLRGNNDATNRRSYKYRTRS